MEDGNVDLRDDWDARLLADMDAVWRRSRRRLAWWAVVAVVCGGLLMAATVAVSTAGGSYSCSLAPTGLPVGGVVTVRYSPPDGIPRTVWDAAGPHTMSPGSSVTVRLIDGTHVFYPTSAPVDRTDMATLVALCLPAPTTVPPVTSPPVTTAPTSEPVTTTSTVVPGPQVPLSSPPVGPVVSATPAPVSPVVSCAGLCTSFTG